MGSLKDDIRGPTEDHQHCERTEDEEYPGSSNSDPTSDKLPINISQPSTSENVHQSNVHNTTNCDTKEDKSGTPKAQAVSLEACGEESDSIHIKDCMQTDCVTPIQQPGAEPLEPLGIENEDTLTSATNDPSDLSPTERGNDTEEDQSTDRDETESVPAQHPLVPCSPAPSGQHHIQTQVSLEVVQCHSVATSPMTPPEGDQAFFFPFCSGRPGAAETYTKDAELQVGRQVEFRSVATAPMTPRTPITTTFPEFDRGAEAERMAERPRDGDEQTSRVTQTPAGSEPDGDAERIPAGELVEATRLTSDTSPQNSSNSIPIESAEPQVIMEASHPEGRQHVQRMVSRDQDITILVTHHGSTEEEDEEGETEFEFTHCPIGPEKGEINADNTEEKGSATKDATEKHITTGNCDDCTGSVQHVQSPTANVSHTKITTKEATVLSSEDSETDKQSQNTGIQGTKEEEGFREEPRVVPQAAQPESTLTKPPIPGSMAPSGNIHHIHTQVSLEVVQCHSVATSPMTPPDRDHAFFFPNTCARSAAAGADMMDAELQVGQQVEFRSVATAPMTPRTPTAPMGFPETRREEHKEEKILEEKNLEEKILEEKNLEEKILKEKNMEEKNMEEKNLEEKILEEKSLEEKILEEKILEEKILEEKSLEEKILEEKNLEEKILKENILKEKNLEEKILEEDEVSEKNGLVTTERVTAAREVASTEDNKAEIVEEKKTDGAIEEEQEDECVEKCEEPVQEVSWDEKGMTWEVYGAVVEVAVLGSAIQKHLEKQVKKQRKQPSLPPPPPLNPAALPLPSASPVAKAGRKRERDAKAGRRRRNPFRLLLQNIQQPHCCSRAHTSD